MLIQTYRPQWVLDFVNIRDVLQTVLEGIPVVIEHVGSTAVPGLAAKPIIDLDLVYPPEVDFECIKSQLLSLDYYHNGDQGIADREVFKRNKSGVAHPVLDTITHHLYVCPAHSAELKKHLAFRDYLRSNAQARQQYEVLKYQLAEQANQDKKRYAALKEQVFIGIPE